MEKDYGDAPWLTPARAVSGTFHWMETSGQIEDPLARFAQSQLSPWPYPYLWSAFNWVEAIQYGAT